MSGPSQTRLHLVDTSANARISNAAVRSIIASLIADGAAATCVTVDLEAGYSGRNLTDVATIYAQRRALYVELPINEAVAERAREVQIRMAQRGKHRAAGIVDLLTAAAAEHHGATVLHYDADFEHIASVTGQPHVWVAPSGSLP